MIRTSARQLTLLSAAATVPVCLGVAMHLEHQATMRACEARLAASDTSESVAMPSVLAVPTPIAVTPATAVEPELAGPGAGAYEFAWTLDIDGPHVVLATAIEESWGVDAPHYRGAVHDVFEDAEVWRNVALERLPPMMRAAVGRTLDVYSQGGRVCTARVGTPVLVGEMTGTIEYLGEDAVEVEREGDAQVIDPASAWDDSRRLLVAPLLDGGDCEGALWARDAALSQPLVYVAQDEDDLPSPVARRLLQRAPETRALGQLFAEHVASVYDEPFTTRRLVDRFHGIRWIEPTRGGELDVFTADGEEFGGCGGFGVVWGAVSIDAYGTPTHAWLRETSEQVAAVIDLEADGKPEVLAEDGWGPRRLLTIDVRITELAALPEVPFYGCPC